MHPIGKYTTDTAVSPVESALNRLEASINATALDFENLAFKLAPVLWQDVPADPSSSPGVKGVPLVDRLHELALKVEALQSHVLNVSSRLAL